VLVGTRGRLVLEPAHCPTRLTVVRERASPQRGNLARGVSASVCRGQSCRLHPRVYGVAWPVAAVCLIDCLTTWLAGC
jgi:hypothetical protein